MFANPPVPLTSTPPVTEGVAAAVGTGAAAARDNHVHQRLTSTTVQALGANGDALVMFTRSFDAIPGVVLTAYKASDGLPVTLDVVADSWVMVNGKFAGCTIHGSKARTLPAVIALLTTLINYNIFAGDATGTQFSCVAIQASN